MSANRSVNSIRGNWSHFGISTADMLRVDDSFLFRDLPIIIDERGYLRVDPRHQRPPADLLTFEADGIEEVPIDEK